MQKFFPTSTSQNLMISNHIGVLPQSESNITGTLFKVENACNNRSKSINIYETFFYSTADDLKY